MARRKESEYIFADAYIGCFVRNLMNRQELIRLASCTDFDSAEALLQEHGYGESPEVKAGDMESFIRREQNRLFDMIYNTLPDRKELALYLLPYDYHNIKVCLKAELLGITPSIDILMSSGDIEYQKMQAMIRDRNYTFMPTAMAEAINEAVDLYGRSQDPQVIDTIMDKSCYKEMRRLADESGEDFLIGIVKFQIDLLNIKLFARLREIGKEWSFFQSVFLEGGNIDEQFFVQSWEEPYSQVADKLVPFGLKDVMAEGGAEIKENGSFALLEKKLEDALMEYNKKAKYESFGIVPIAGYWLAKEVEIDNLRIILTAMSVGLSPEEIGERIREPYV